MLGSSKTYSSRILSLNGDELKNSLEMVFRSFTKSLVLTKFCCSSQRYGSGTFKLFFEKIMVPFQKIWCKYSKFEYFRLSGAYLFTTSFQIYHFSNFLQSINTFSRWYKLRHRWYNLQPNEIFKYSLSTMNRH